MLEDSLVKEGVYIMMDVYYDLEKTFLRPESSAELDKLYLFLKRNPTLVIEIGNHVSVVTGQMCSDLSGGRAKSIADYLSSKGIDRRRIVPKGYGERKLIYTAEAINKLKTEEEKQIAHMKNRRTEIRILRNDFSAEPIEGK